MYDLELNWAQIRDADALADIARALLGQMLCAWHGGCNHQAEGTTSHPVLGAVAICSECACTDHVDVTPFPALRAVA